MYYTECKNCDMLPLGGLFILMGLNSSLSSPTSEQVSEKGGRNVGNQKLVADYGFIGLPGP